MSIYNKLMQKIKKYPLILIIIGIHGLLAVSLVLLFYGFKVASIFPLIIISVSPLILLLTGIKQIVKEKKKKQ